MTASNAGPLKIALVHHTYGSPPSGGVERIVHEVAAGLRDAGHRPTILASHRRPTRIALEDGVQVVRVARLPEAPLRMRGFTGPLTHLPLTLRALGTGDYDVAHAFSPPDAHAALLWRRRTRRPVVFTCAEILDRSVVADGRLRLRLLGAAIERADAVLASTAASQAALDRWLALPARVMDRRDGAALGALYEGLGPLASVGRVPLPRN